MTGFPSLASIARLHPLRCDRAETKAVKPNRLERWERIAVEAAKQSGRSVVPRITPVVELPVPGPGGPLALLLSPERAARPLGDILAEKRPGPVWLAIGPESGFSEREAERKTWSSEESRAMENRGQCAGEIAVAHRIG